MKLIIICSLCLFTFLIQDTDKLVYADFESAESNRPVSSRGGRVQMFGYEQNPNLKSKWKGLAGSEPPAPEFIRTKDAANRAIGFDFDLQSTNAFAGVGVQIHGQPEKDGKPVADDVSGFKDLTMQVYAIGVSTVSVELVSQGQGIQMMSGYPQMSFKVSPGLNTYKIDLSKLKQPEWAQTKVNTKEVLKKLTSINISVSCAQCTQTKGTLVIDNLVFQK
jgi:hypothetical protein